MFNNISYLIFSECGNNMYGLNCATSCACTVGHTETCNNVNGSCTCLLGWQGVTCDDDVDECNVTNKCNDTLKECFNSMGSYECKCPSGYTLFNDGKCHGKYFL